MARAEPPEIIEADLGAASEAAQEKKNQPLAGHLRARRYTLVEDFTADTLGAGEFKIGTDLQYGLTSDLMLGTDLIATVIGAPSVETKYLAWHKGAHAVAIGLRAAYLSRNTVLWGDLKEQFSVLDARMLRPSLSWTRTLSPRLKLHTFFAKGFGHITAVLSPRGQRKLWQAKHPGADYETRDPATQKPTSSSADHSDADQETTSQRSAISQKTIQVQSLAGLAQERFQLSGEFTRLSGNKVIVTSDIEQTQLESLKTNFFRLTVAHQWIWENFQMRIGFGPQYFVLTGRDLDGEAIDESGWTPASDISFYWRF